MRSIPRVNLQQFTVGSPEEQQAFVEHFGQGLMDFGFVTLTGHGIDRAVSRRAYDAATAFFDLPETVKSNYEFRQIGRQRGYTPMGKERAKDYALSDLKEFWHTGGEGIPHLPQNTWPKEVATFGQAMTGLFGELFDVGVQLMHALERFLEIPERQLSDMLLGGNTVLRSIHYPVPENIVPGQLWAGAHEDINLMTLLIEASGSGLEILTKKGQWLPVHCDPAEIIVDTGDMMQQLTNGLLPAVTHRVVSPADCAESRYSMPFFIHPAPETSLAPLTSPLIPTRDKATSQLSAAAYLNERLRQNGVLTVDFDPLEDSDLKPA